MNLDCGSNNYNGAKVPLCKSCAHAAHFCYRNSSIRSHPARHLPKLCQKFLYEGDHVVRLCGRKVEDLIKPKEYGQWVADHGSLA